MNYNAHVDMMTDVVASDVARQLDDDDDDDSVHRWPLLDTTNNIVIVGQCRLILLQVQCYFSNINEYENGND